MKEIFIFLLVTCLFGGVQAHKKVLLSDVNTITLKAGEMTTGRRSSPVPQLTCVGGKAANKYKPRVAQCTKVGFDGLSYQWRCTAEMPTEYEFGKVTVNCEGYDYSDDKYILHGSCGLEYELEYTSDLKRSTSNNTFLEWLGTFLVVILIVIVLIAMCRKSGDGTIGGFGTDRYSGYPGDGPGYPPDDYGFPGKSPDPYPSAPPTYEESQSYEIPRQRQRPQHRTNMGFGMGGGGQRENEGPGFWTGAGLGALGGYFMGRNMGQQPTTSRSAGSSFGFSNTQRTRTPTPPRQSGDLHESTGYGGTTRR